MLTTVKTYYHMIKNYINNNILKAMKVLCLGGLMAFSSTAYSQLSGTKTLGTGGDYTSWSSLASAIRTSGVNGKLTVTMLNDMSLGGSRVTFQNPSSKKPTSTNQIVIDGNGKKLTYTGYDAAIVLNGVSYLTIEDLKLEHTRNASDNKGIQFMGNAQYNTIDGCTISFPNQTSSTTSTFSGGAYIVFSNSLTTMNSSTSSYHNGSYNTVQNCTMTTRANSNGPTSAIHVYGSSSRYTSTAANNTFKNNTIKNFYVYGFYDYYSNGDQFINNDVSNDVNTSRYISSYVYMMYSYRTYSTNRSTKFEGNKFHDLPYKNAPASMSFTSTVYGMYGYYNYGTSSNFWTVKDNTFENIQCRSTSYFGYCYYNYYADYDGNVVDKWTNNYSTSYTYGWRIYYNYNHIKFNRNEIKNCYSRGYTYYVYMYYPRGQVQVDYNKIHDNKTAQNTSGWTYVMYIYRPNRNNANSVSYNEIKDNRWGYYSYDLYTYYFDGKVNNNVIMNNYLEKSSGTPYGYQYTMQNYYFYNLQVNNNVIIDNPGYYGSYPMYNYSFNSGNYKLEVRDNTVKLDGDKDKNNYQYNYNYLYIYPYYHNKIAVTGNAFDFRNVYYAYIYTYNRNGTTPYDVWDYNNYWFKSVGTSYFYGPGGNAYNVRNWMNTGLPGDHETGHMPIYKDEANDDYRITVFELQNKVPLFDNHNPQFGYNQNTIDNEDYDRNLNKHDHGALEDTMDIIGTKSDATIAATVCSGYEFEGDIYIKNDYVDTVYGFNVTMMTDRGSKVTQTVDDKILPGNTLQVKFDEKMMLSEAGITNIMIFVDAADDNLSNDTIYLKTEVLPAPGGGEYTASTKATKAIYQTAKEDITILGESVIYDMNSPTKYGNSDWDTSSTATTGWMAEVQAYTASGATVSGATLTAPTSSSDMEIQFVTNDATYEDSMITLVTRVIDHVNGCDTMIKTNVFIYPSITPLFTFPSQICEGEAILFENKSKALSGGMEFKWDFGTGVAADMTDAPEPVFQFPGSKTYKVNLEAKTVPYGFTFDTTIDVTGNPIPTVAFAKTNACEGEALTFTNKTTPTNADMKWNFGDGTSSTSANPTKTYTKAGQYEVTLEADLNGCVATMTQKVYQFDRPVADFEKADGNCDNDVFEFENKSTIAAGLFGSFWDFDDNGSVSTDDAAMYDFSTSGDKMVKLVVTSEFGCKDSMSKTITVKESPKVNFTNGPLCSVKPTDFINTTPDVANAIASYFWNFGDGTTSGAKSPTHNWNGNLGPKKVSLKVVLDNGCEQELMKDLVVLTQPKPEFTAGEACSGEDIAFVNNTTWAQGKISYKWDFGDGTTSNNSDPVKVYNVTQSYYPNVTLYAYIDGGCADSITKTNYVLINEKPRTCDFVAEVDYSYGFYGVKVEPMNTSGVVGGQNDADYIWIFEGAGTEKTSGADAAAFANMPADGEYKITMRATMQQSGCDCQASKTIVMNRSSVEDLQSVGVAVFPNPNTGLFRVMTKETFGKNITVEMLDMNGRVVKSSKMQGGSMEVDARDLSKGMYLVRVSNGEETVTRKINIQ